MPVILTTCSPPTHQTAFRCNRPNRLAPPHRITSSAETSRSGGTVKSSAFAVLRLALLRDAQSTSFTWSTAERSSPMAACSSTAKEETPDGFRIDVDSNLWCGWGMSPALDGVKVFNPAGKAIGFIALPERAANVCFGGRYRNRLFMAASHSIYSLYVNTQGVAGG